MELQRCERGSHPYPQNEQDFVLSLVNKRKRENSFIVTHNFLIFLFGRSFLESELCLLSRRRSTSQSSKVLLERLVRNHVQPLSSPTHRMVQNLEVVCTACSHCHTSSSDASFKDSRGCSLCWASLSHNLSRRSSRPPSSKPTPPSVYSSRCVIPMARPPATVNTCSSSSPTSIFLLAHMRQPCSTPPHMVPHSGR
ncbi:hypothetical protein JHK84_044876 [Glycine max]|nr:hypothetical protein JHK85_045383 [Glycine max]KAG5107969.1 hypothetical protein JHK84_044876 [Glycine max]